MLRTRAWICSMYHSVAYTDRCPDHASYMTVVWPFLVWQSKLICTHFVCQNAMTVLCSTGSLLQISPHPFSLQKLNLYTLLSFSACGRWNSHVHYINGERQLIEDEISHHNSRKMCVHWAVSWSQKKRFEHFIDTFWLTLVHTYTRNISIYEYLKVKEIYLAFQGTFKMIII